jgi:hypothetical protein
MNKEIDLNQILSNAIENLLHINKKAASSFLKLSKSAFAPELAKALDPEQTFIENHRSRLQLLKKLIPCKPKAVNSIIKIDPFKLAKHKSSAQDKLIITYALLLLSVQNAHYHCILMLNKSLDIPYAVELIDQSISENSNTEIWITRTFNNLNQN